MTGSVGFHGLIYRTSLGLHRAGASGHVADLRGPLWDVYVGGLPFLLANSGDNPYIRESTSARRDRFDAARDPGDNSLDSALWLRSSNSWHLGQGQEYAEPLEGSAEDARFRYFNGGGVDVWTPGQLSLINASTLKGTAARRCLGTASGVLVSGTTGMSLYPSSGSATALSTKTITGHICSNGTQWFGASTTGIEYGLLTTGGEGQVVKSGLTALNWAKDRLWAGAGAELWEITTLSPPTLPGAATHTFRSGSIVDIEAGAGAVYVMINDALTSIYCITVASDGSLNAPREVAVLPRGESGLCLYGYLGRYLAIGTSRGVRVADCSTDTALPIGPLIVEMTGGCADIVGDDTFLYATTGTEGISPDAVNTRPGLYRIDLSHAMNLAGQYGDTAATLFPYAADLYQPGTGTLSGQGWSVTSYGGRIWYVAGASASGSSLYNRADTYSTTGWVDSGVISFSTAERKAWLSLSIEVDGGGSLYLEGNVGSGWVPVTQTSIGCPRRDDLEIDAEALPAANSFRHRLGLTGDGATTPIVKAVSLRATPVPRRTRYIRLPLLCFDRNVDRNQNPVGYDGFAADRLFDLEALEESGALVTLIDQRTGESKRCLIDRVSFNNISPPDRRFSGFGGVISLTLLVV